MTKLTLDNIAKRFGRRVLFRKLTCEVEGGRVLAITGANGSGKSTLLKIIAGVMTPSKGAVGLEVAGQQISTDDRPLQVGYVAPYLNVYDGFSARENLEFISKVRQLSKTTEEIDALITQVTLKGRENDLVQNYSSGMKQRVKFAAAMLTTPDVLILDEPSTNLDAPGIEMVKRVIQSQRDRNGVVILASNSKEEVAWCDEALSVQDYK